MYFVQQQWVNTQRTPTMQWTRKVRKAQLNDYMKGLVTRLHLKTRINCDCADCQHISMFSFFCSVDYTLFIWFHLAWHFSTLLPWCDFRGERSMPESKLRELALERKKCHSLWKSAGAWLTAFQQECSSKTSLCKFWSTLGSCRSQLGTRPRYFQLWYGTHIHWVLSTLGSNEVVSSCDREK